MSGICTIVHRDGSPMDEAHVVAMTQAAAHRGPDGINVWSGEGASLASLALNVTPESIRERQPIRHGNLVLVADARVDNRDDLIASLARSGLTDQPTDADLILASFRRWSTACAAHIIGSFAFAVWDSDQRRLFAARDPMGGRALYYRIEPGRILLASEVKQILAFPSVPARIHEPMLGAYLAVNAGQPEWTFYKGIFQVPPGSALVADDTSHRTWRYWDIDPEHRIEHRDTGAYVEEFREIFLDAVMCRMRAVKPIGISLSGGLDSGSIAAAAGWLRRRGISSRLRAYSYAFDELAESDERHISNLIVDHYSLKAIDVPADDAWPLHDFPEHGPDPDEPLMGAYQVLHDRVYALARRDGVGLMLTGAHGDYVAGGGIYDYVDQLRSLRLGTVWDDLREHSLQTGVGLFKMGLEEVVAAAARSIWPPGRAPRLRRLARRIARRPGPAPGWLNPAFARRIRLAELVEAQPAAGSWGSTARRRRYETIFDPLAARGEIWNERNHARFGLGRADPWRDRRLAEFAVAIPQRVLNRGGQTKLLVREAMEGIMPDSARAAAGKIYPSPLYQRGITDRARPTIEALLTDSELASRGYVDADRLRDHYAAVAAGVADEDELWPTLTAEIWLRQHWQ